MKQLNKQVKVQKKIGSLRDENNMLVYDNCEKATIMNIFFATIREKLAYNLSGLLLRLIPRSSTELV